MRTLSAALQAATMTGTAAPLLKLELLDAVPHYAAVFTGGPTGRHSAVLAADGAVVQAYHDGVQTVYARRVTDPTATSWGAWTVVAASAAPGAGVALARLSDRLRLFWQSGAGTAIQASDSFDNGASWGAPVALFDPGTAVSGLAADWDAGTVFAAYSVAGGLWRVAVWSLHGAAWAAADWSNGDAAAIVGLGAVRNADGSYLVAAAIQASAATGTALEVSAYAPPGAPSAGWGALVAVAPADLGAGVATADPRLSVYDGRYHLAYAVADSGTTSGLVSARAALAHSFDGIHWTDPLEDANSYAHGAAPLKHGEGYLLAAPDTAALAPLYSGAPAQYRDCSADVSRLEVVQKDGDPARLVVTLQNDAAQYSGLTALRPNATLRLSLGYAGAGAVPAYLCYIDDWSFVRAADEHELVITASDAAAWLDRQSRTTLQYTGYTVDWLAREILARAGGLAVTLPATAQFSQVVPAFTIPAGTTWRDALARLSRLYGFDAAARTQQDGSDSFVIIEKNAADAPVWSYGGEAEQMVLARSGDRANHILVFGAPAAGGPPVGEAWDWADVADCGQERYLHVVEPMITTRAGASIRATLDLNREVRLGHSGSLAVALHPGLELWDVVTTGGGVFPAATLRVATLHHIYEPHPGTYDVVLTFEAP